MSKHMFIRCNTKKTTQELTDMGFQPVSVFINKENQLLFISPEKLITDEVTSENTPINEDDTNIIVDYNVFDLLTPYLK